ncbi:MAG TPA: diaminopimelate decarboxylase [Caulobacterales bacterium]|nr:diaminopimelate decarboxylase [Caulobacterales bacterium]
MHHFTYRQGQMVCEDVPLGAIAQAVGTPAYVYSSATLERHYDVFKAALAPRTPLIAFAVKANSNLAVLATLARRGAGADTVSAGEIARALKAGVPPDRIIFSGVGKSEDELAFACSVGVAQINIESIAELAMLEEVAKRARANPAISIRVNPGIGAGGNSKISTGGGDAKFGVSAEDAIALYHQAAQSRNLRPQGLAVHIGSQIKDLSPLEETFRLMRTLAERLRAEGRTIDHLDLGGGLGIPYFHEPEPPTPAAYGAMVNRVFEGMDIALAFEPGRLIAGNAGILLSRVIRIQERPDRQFLVLDAAMNDLIRPAMYDAFHDIQPVAEPPAGAARMPIDVVGPICETGDTFARARPLPPLKAGDLVALMTAGAYGAVMSSAYNSRPITPEVLVSGDRFAVVRDRFEVETQLKLEHMPPWLSPE